MGFFSNLFRVNAPAGHPFPDLYPLELKIERAIKGGRNITFDMKSDGLTKEKWAYLSKKYRELSIPITHPFNTSHDHYLKRFLSVKDDIIAGRQISLDEVDEKYLTAFAAVELPGMKVLAVRPTVIKCFVAGFRFYGYKNKVIKEMLIMDPSQILDPEPEPENRFDDDAIKLNWEGEFIGYVPREYSSEVATAVREKKSVTCWIKSYDSKGPIDERLWVEITINHFKAPSLLSKN